LWKSLSSTPTVCVRLRAFAFEGHLIHDCSFERSTRTGGAGASRRMSTPHDTVRHPVSAQAARRLAGAPISWAHAGTLAETANQIERMLETSDVGFVHLHLEDVDAHTAITGQEPPVGSGPVLDVKTSIEYLYTPAPGGERSAKP
jgi:hypothetical protein